MNARRRLAIVVSHPIQYQAPWFRELSGRVDLTVFFCHRQNPEGQSDAGYGVAFDWDVPVLDGYRSVWLDNVSPTPGVFAWGGCDTPEIRTHLEHGRFDACIVSGWYLKSYLQAIVACRRLGIPVFLRGDSHLNTSRSLLTRAVKQVVHRALLNAVSGHLYVGALNRAYLEHYGVPERRLFFVPHVVDDRRFQERAAAARDSGEAARLRQELGIGADTALALFVGRLVPSKRPLDFVNAVAAASRSHHIAGVVAGSGPLGDVVRARVAETGAPIRLEGFVNQSRLPALYAASQMLVLPSDAAETWGLVVNEAMASGCPAVVSDAVGCARDLIEPATGRTFPLGDTDRLARALCDLEETCRTDPDRVRRALASKTAVHSAAAAADRTVEAVDRILSELRRHRTSNTIEHVPAR